MRHSVARRLSTTMRESQTRRQLPRPESYLLLLMVVAYAPSRHRVRLVPVRPTCPEQLTVWTEEVLQWRYRTFPVVPVECRESRASVPASVVPGHILGSWGQLCCCCCCCCCYDKSSTPISESFCDIHSSLRRVRRPTSFVTTSPHHIARRRRRRRR